MTAVLTETLHVVLPADVDDPARPSGGNRYDRRILGALGAGEVAEILAAGSWPHPAASDLEALAAALAAVPTGGTVLLDGLVACAAPSVVVPEAARLRLVVLVHLPLGDEAGASSALVARERAVLHAAAAVVATSAWSADRIAAVHGLSGVRVVQPGTDPAPVAPGSGGRALLCVGSLTPTKGQDVLVAALARLRGDWTCLLVGPLDRAPAFAGSLRSAAGVTLTGPLSGPALDAAYAAADVLVLPSRAESYGMVLVEALARGIPVVAADVGGVREAVGVARSGELPGLLVPPADPAALAAALQQALDPAVHARLRRAALDRRDTLPTWSAAAGELREVLEGVRR